MTNADGNDRAMFCYQCEQTMKGTGCTICGVCGKSPETAMAQDELTGELIALAHAIKAVNPPSVSNLNRIIRDGLFTTVTNVNFSHVPIAALAAEACAERIALAPDFKRFDLREVWRKGDDVRSLKSLILFGCRGMAAYSSHAAALGYRDRHVGEALVSSLDAVGYEDDPAKLLDTALALGSVNYAAMGLLDHAHTAAFGAPGPVSVTLDVEPGPFIVVTGHDLLDLKMLLDQTDGKGVNVYTHGEMLPAHGYPKLRAHPQLKGNFGTAWQNQQREFDDLPAPILWTTNCLMIPRPSYADRVWTTGVVSYPGTHHIDDGKDFSGLIAMAKRLKGWKETHRGSGVNGGRTVTTGYGHAAILANADRIIDAVKRGRIRRFFLVGGCDGAKSGRSYFTEFVKAAPKDTVILTLACGKYRFNDLDLGEIDGIPRLLDVGQCNDAYGAIQVAVALAKAFGCRVDELPLSFVLSWYEQKAVAVLLTLLAMGVRDIRLGPTLPAFLSEGVLETLGARFGLRQISTPSEDLAAMLG